MAKNKGYVIEAPVTEEPAEAVETYEPEPVIIKHSEPIQKRRNIDQV